MSDSEHSTSTSTSGNADAAMPPVQAPTGGFILQLFLIPMVIVTIIVMVFLLFNWLASMGSSPTDLVRALKTPNETGWQKAHNLSDMLRHAGDGRLKDDSQLANELASVLEQHLETGKTDNNSVLMRVFICKSLGEFRVSSVMPVLIRAAQTERSSAELHVRDAAIQALAVLMQNLREKGQSDEFESDDELHEALFKAAGEFAANPDEQSEREELRSVSAFALGVLGSEEAKKRMAQMLADPFPNVRYNAATGLARHGDARAIRVLLEMLDPGNESGVSSEASASEKARKRNLIVMNGIRAALQLAEQLPASEMQEVLQAVREIAESDLPQSVRIEAESFLQSQPAGSTSK